MSWSATQYSKFEKERNRPTRDLIAQIPANSVHCAADIGCGPGNSTELLAARFPDAAISGVDSSPEMIETARRRLPEIRFDVDNLASWATPQKFDVILANAVLQWVPDHASVVPALLSKIAPGGSLAVQIPDNLEEPAQRLMRETAANGRWSDKLAQVLRSKENRRSADWYYSTLRNLGATINVWRTTFYHPLPDGATSIVEWFKGTGLRPFLEPLDETERSSYLSVYKAAVEKAYPALSDGTVLLPFPRLFFVATVP